MELAEKLRRLRQAEGMRRGLWRAMTQQEVIRAMRHEIGVSLSQAYLSQLEGGQRLHLSSATREALARFYHVHPGYLLSDPPGAALEGAAPAPPASGPTPSGQASEQESDALLTTTLARLAAATEPERALRLVDWLLSLPPDALTILEQRMAESAATSMAPIPTPTEAARQRAR
ncbi:MAG TPA: hypothetical protein VE338_00885 [Ktedonobacterales bacterium]|jgi:transcriptional regulator with XRE-family HTH domain|nr:hypothetical protein [Ktedonobacterales bacterium]